MSDIDLFAAQLNQYIPKIDLHHAGSVVDALEILDIELSRAIVKDKYCRIIYGVGTGALRNAVLKRLKELSFVSKVAEEESGGSCVVVFREGGLKMGDKMVGRVTVG